MRCVVTTIFGTNQTLETIVEVETSKEISLQAHEWFGQRWVELECEPTRASGKVLILDKILGVTEAIGYAKLAASQDAANEFATKAAQALEKPTITINLTDQTISF